MADWIIDVVGKLGYVGIFLLTLLENIFPPIPSELIMPFAGFHTVDGEMSFAGAVAAGSAGSLLGTLGWYWFGRRVGERRLRSFVERRGRWLAIDLEDVDKAQDWFHRHGALAVFFGRLVPAVRTLISVPAGLDRMPLWKFLLPSAAGTILWTAGLTYAGRLLEQNYTQVKTYVEIASWTFLGFAVAAYAWRQVRYFLGRGRSAPRVAQ